MNPESDYDQLKPHVIFVVGWQVKFENSESTTRSRGVVLKKEEHLTSYFHSPL